MDSPKILSIMEDYLGHRTYGNLLRECFNKSSFCQVDSYWYREDRKISEKIVNRLLSFKFPNQWIQKQNLDFHYSRTQTGFAYLTKQLAGRKLNHKDYSALYFHTYILAFLSVELMKKLPTVVSLDMTTFQASQEKTDPSFRWTYNTDLFQGKRVFETSTRVLAWSEWARKSVIEDYKIDENKVQILYPGVNTAALTPSESSQVDVQKPFNILFLGGDFKRKGGQDVLDVFLETFSNKAELHLVTQAPIKCQHPNVHIHDDVKPYTPKWLELYRQADVFVLPTHFEAFGIVFIEAMAAGLPVIATRINAIPEIVIHGETGFLIEPGDRHELAYRIRCLMENLTLAKEMGAKGRKVVEQKFNVQKHCQTLESIFEKIAVFRLSS